MESVENDNLTEIEKNRLVVALFDPSPVAKWLGQRVDAGFAVASHWTPGWEETAPDKWKSLPWRTRVMATLAADVGEFCIWINRRRADRKFKSKWKR